MTAQDMYDWIMARFDDGMTVYVASYGRIVKCRAKHRAMFRVRGDHCELQRGKRWDSINYCKITARAE